MTDRIPFLDLHAGEDAPAVREAVERVLGRGWFVLGPEVEAFEGEFAAAAGARFAVGVGNGTDAIALALRAAGIGSGDEVIVPAMTAAFTAMAVLAAGATPVFADVEPDTLTLDPASCRSAVTARTRALVPVHLYGQAADLDSLYDIAERHSLVVVEDCCQAHLATHRGTPVGTRGTAGAFSFYPTKNLGALGDGGAVITNDSAIADRIRRLRNGGQQDRYVHVEAGVNSRLDEIHAAVLRARLPYLAGWTARRRELARTYRRALGESVETVAERDAGHVYHLFPVRSAARDALRAHLSAAGVDTLIHYPIALDAQPGFARYRRHDCGQARRAARELLSLPLHPRLTGAQVEHVAAAVRTFAKGHVPA